MATSEISKGPRLPYDGLFGDSNLIRVIRQVIADPFTTYRPMDLEILTKNCTPTVRDSLKILTSIGLLIKDESDHQHPVYRVNTESKRYLALTILAYAVLDDRNGTDTMDEVIADYCKSELKGSSHEAGETYELSQPLAGVGTGACYAVNNMRHLLQIKCQPQGVIYKTTIPTGTRPALEERSKQKINEAIA
jgi:hypothetical protein